MQIMRFAKNESLCNRVMVGQILFDKSSPKDIPHRAECKIPRYLRY